jgi:hypothetical protein
VFPTKVGLFESLATDVNTVLAPLLGQEDGRVFDDCSDAFEPDVGARNISDSLFHLKRTVLF